MKSHRQTVGRQIRSLRRRKRYTLEQLAAKAGMDWKYLGQVERGHDNISLDRLAKLADALEVPLSSLFDKPGKPPPILNDRYVRRAAEILRDVQAERKGVILKLMAELAKQRGRPRD